MYTARASLIVRTCITTPSIITPETRKLERGQLAHYCIVRADLPHGVQAAQLIHAAGESSPGNIPAHTFAIALHARDEKHLQDIAWSLAVAGIKHNIIMETDPPYGGAAMSIGIPPMDRAVLKPILSSLPLVR
jgi:hypothetical protein